MEFGYSLFIKFIFIARELFLFVSFCVNLLLSTYN